MNASLRVLLFILLIAPFQSKADVPEVQIPLPETVTLDNREYTRAQLIDLFLEATIAEYELPEGRKPEFTLMSKSEMGARYPWIAPYVFREDGLPKSGVINKWPQTEIAVSIGYPNKLKDFGSSWDYWWKRNSNQRYYSFVEYIRYGSPFVNAIETETAQIVEELNKFSLPIKLSYQEHDHETKKRYASIRIIPFGENLEIDDNKRYKSDGGSFTISDWTRKKPVHLRTTLFENVNGKISFTSDKNTGHVEGHLLTNSSNQIALSLCYLYEGHEQGIRQSLIKECILRSLGLVNTFKNSGSFLSRPATKHSSALTEFDLFLTNLLYRPEIKAGSDVSSIQLILTKGAKNE